METKADNLDPIKLINYYKQQLAETQYNLFAQNLLNNQLRELIAEIVANHPELEEEVKNGSSNQQINAGRKQE